VLFLDPGSGINKIRIRDKHPGSATLSITMDEELKDPLLKFYIPALLPVIYHQCCVSGSGIQRFFYPWIRDGKKNFIMDSR
jgi:hypothetical protein